MLFRSKYEYVYFIKYNRIPGVVKIGKSKDVKKRIQRMNTYAPYGVTLIGHIKTYDSERLEKMFHYKFSNLRQNGEWFQLDEEEVHNLLDEHNGRLMNRGYITMFLLGWKDIEKYLGKKVYNSEFCDEFRKYIQDDNVANREILNRLKKFCNRNNLEYYRDRDHEIGRAHV